MKIVIFTHSLRSDWNHGNAHFLRGIAVELQSRRHEVVVYEPENAWSVQNLVAEYGPEALTGFQAVYPTLYSIPYQLDSLDLNVALHDADLVLVHEWNEHDLVRRIGEYRAGNLGLRLLFHDTHHRAVTDPHSMAAYDLSHYDGVLAFGSVIRDLYLQNGWTKRAWTWHEAADVRVFHPYPEEGEREKNNSVLAQPASIEAPSSSGVESYQEVRVSPSPKEGDLVWIGNWGDEERTEELHEFLLGPVKTLGLRAMVYGVRYPAAALQALQDAGIAYGGWLPNYKAPRVFSRYRVTVHVPRRPYVAALPGIPTIRVFEALACGIPLVSAPWQDSEHLFTPGEDFLVAHDGEEMQRCLRILLDDPSRAQALACHGLKTIRARHTCAHRVDELLDIYSELETR